LQDIGEAATLGISGVPFFVFNRKYGISGAQPLSVFTDTLQKVRDEAQA
jgi:predicted DsbA family dithiol-disulfide isomerase